MPHRRPRLRSQRPRTRSKRTYDGPHRCRSCDAAFLTAQGLADHVTAKHQPKLP